MASITTLSNLKANIYDFLIRDTNDSFFNTARIENVIGLAEDYLNSNLRVREMRKTANIAITGGDNTADLPDDLVEVVGLYLNTNGANTELIYASAGVFAQRGLYSASGIPRFFYFDANKIVLGAVPISDATAVIDYYAEIPALSDLQTTNSVLARYSDLYLSCCLMIANRMLKDTEQEAKYLASTEQLIAKYNKMDGKGVRATGNKAISSRSFG